MIVAADGRSAIGLPKRIYPTGDPDADKMCELIVTLANEGQQFHLAPSNTLCTPSQNRLNGAGWDAWGSGGQYAAANKKQQVARYIRAACS